MQGVLVFMAAGCRLAVSVGDVLRLIVEIPVSPVPFGHRALVGVMPAGDDSGDVVPVFDLRGLAVDAPPPPRHVPGATIAVIPTAIGPIGLRLDRLLGTSARYDAVFDEIPPHIARVIDGAGRADVGARVDGADHTVFFFSTEAFVAAVGLA
jgi:chemotaxis signal transduction protein